MSRIINTFRREFRGPRRSAGVAAVEFVISVPLLIFVMLAVALAAPERSTSRLSSASAPGAGSHLPTFGLGLFAASGTQIALAQGMPAVVAVLMGVITAVFGGVLRDIVCNEIPSAFRDHRPYAVCSFAGGWTYVVLWTLDAPDWMALLGCLFVTVCLRALALWRNWQLPAWRA